MAISKIPTAVNDGGSAYTAKLDWENIVPMLNSVGKSSSGSTGGGAAAVSPSVPKAPSVTDVVEDTGERDYKLDNENINYSNAGYYTGTSYGGTGTGEYYGGSYTPTAPAKEPAYNINKPLVGGVTQRAFAPAQAPSAPAAETTKPEARDTVSTAPSINNINQSLLRQSAAEDSQKPASALSVPLQRGILKNPAFQYGIDQAIAQASNDRQNTSVPQPQNEQSIMNWAWRNTGRGLDTLINLSSNTAAPNNPSANPLAGPDMSDYLSGWQRREQSMRNAIERSTAMERANELIPYDYSGVVPEPMAPINWSGIGNAIGNAVSNDIATWGDESQLTDNQRAILANAQNTVNNREVTGTRVTGKGNLIEDLSDAMDKSGAFLSNTVNSFFNKADEENARLAWVYQQPEYQAAQTTEEKILAEDTLSDKYDEMVANGQIEGPVSRPLVTSADIHEQRDTEMKQRAKMNREQLSGVINFAKTAQEYSNLRRPAEQSAIKAGFQIDTPEFEQYVQKYISRAQANQQRVQDKAEQIYLQNIPREPIYKTSHGDINISRINFNREWTKAEHDQYSDYMLQLTNQGYSPYSADTVARYAVQLGENLNDTIGIIAQQNPNWSQQDLDDFINGSGKYARNTSLDSLIGWTGQNNTALGNQLTPTKSKNGQLYYNAGITNPADAVYHGGYNQATGDLQLQTDIANGKITYDQIYDDYVQNHVSGLYQRYIANGMDESAASQLARQNAMKLAYQRIYDLGYRPDYNDQASIDKYAIPGMMDIIEGMEKSIGNNYWTNGASYNDRLTNMVSGGIDGRNDRLLDDLMSYSAGNAYLNSKNKTNYSTTFGITDPSNPNNPAGWNTALQAAMSGQLTKDQILHMYDSNNSDLIIPEEAKRFFADPSHAIQQLYLNYGKNSGRTQSVEATSEEFQKALQALINANPGLKLMVDNGVLSKDDIAFNFFKELKITDTDDLEEKYKSYGGGYSRSYSSGGGGGGGGGGYSTPNSAASKNQEETRIHNIMKNWTF